LGHQEVWNGFRVQVGGEGRSGGFRVGAREEGLGGGLLLGFGGRLNRKLK